MEQKIVLITGGSSGIGKATGQFLTQKGFKVYGTTRSLGKYVDFREFELVELDVTKEETISTAINHIVTQSGKIDILINNAGVGITGPIEETPIDEINKAFDTNFNGPIRLMQAVLPVMRNQQSGLIINITSIAGYMGLPFRGVYSASKGALELVTEAIRMETKASGIKITTLAPGDFATNIANGRYHAPVIKGSTYEKTYGDSLALMNEHVDHGGDPLLVAKAVYKIIDTTNPKVHYRVGEFTQKISQVLKRLLPDKAFEKLLLKHYKL
ncbi:SDR family oxidoreductase [Flavobacterium sp. ASW18X]|uniref:SDR family oxidoreductase n=1 Tax=Flavobacterium sp. ASW18X TaxID=2572595 RepID=UPI0010AE46C9|nr:SDR family oxidoreductase [Flavobacterium sp. ASW18X]TKD65878.1 SDR family oxidoreductase [Flavobacterium sp. ASW18X]